MSESNASTPAKLAPEADIATEYTALKAKHAELVEKLRGVLPKYKELQTLYAQCGDPNRLMSQLAAAKEDVALLKSKNDDLQSEVEGLSQKLREADDTVSRQQEELSANDDKIEKLTEKLKTFSARGKELASTLQVRTTELSSANAEIESLNEQLAAKQADIEKHQRVLQEKQMENDMYKRRVLELESLVRDASSTTASASDASALQAQLDAVNAALAALRTAFQQEKDEHNTALTAMQDKLAAEVGNLKLVKAELDTLRHTHEQEQEQRAKQEALTSEELSRERQLVADLRAEIAELQSREASTESTVAQQLQTQVAELEEQLKALEAEHERERVMWTQKMQDASAAVDAEKAELSATCETLRQQLTAEQAKITTLNETLAVNATAAVDPSEISHGSLQELQAQVDALQLEKERLEATHADAMKEAQILARQQKQASEDRHKEAVTALQAELTSLQHLNDLNAHKEARQAAKIQQLETALVQLRDHASVVSTKARDITNTCKSELEAVKTSLIADVLDLPTLQEQLIARVKAFIAEKQTSAMQSNVPVDTSASEEASWQAEKTALQQQLDALKAQLEQEASTHQQQMSQLKEKASAGLNKLKAQRDDLTARNTSLTTELESYRAQCETLQADTQNLQTQADEATQELQAARNKCSTLETQVKDLLQQINAAQSQLSESKQKLQERTSERDVFQQQLLQTKQELDACSTRVKEQQAQLENAQSRIAELESEHRMMAAQSADDTAALQAEKQVLFSKVHTLEERLRNAQAEHDKHAKQPDNMLPLLRLMLPRDAFEASFTSAHTNALDWTLLIVTRGSITHLEWRNTATLKSEWSGVASADKSHISHVLSAAVASTFSVEKFSRQVLLASDEITSEAPSLQQVLRSLFQQREKKHSDKIQALDTQLQTTTKQLQDVQQEYLAYKQKASAALRKPTPSSTVAAASTNVLKERHHAEEADDSNKDELFARLIVLETSLNQAQDTIRDKNAHTAELQTKLDAMERRVNNANAQLQAAHAELKQQEQQALQNVEQYKTAAQEAAAKHEELLQELQRTQSALQRATIENEKQQTLIAALRGELQDRITAYNSLQQQQQALLQQQASHTTSDGMHTNTTALTPTKPAVSTSDDSATLSAVAVNSSRPSTPATTAATPSTAQPLVSSLNKHDAVSLLERLLTQQHAPPAATATTTTALAQHTSSMQAALISETLDDYDVRGLRQKLGEVLLELTEVRAQYELGEQQMQVLKDTIRELERQLERYHTLSTTTPTAILTTTGGGGETQLHSSSTPHAKIRATTTPGVPWSSHSSAGTSDTNPTVNIEYLKNAVVAYMCSKHTEERRRMVPAISLLLSLSPEETARIQQQLDGESSGGIGLFSSMFAR